MKKSKSSQKILCSCGCCAQVTRRTQTRHLQGNGPTLALAEMFETRNYFATEGTNNARVGRLGGDVHPPKRRRIAPPEPGPPLSDTSPQVMPDTPAVSPDEVLSNWWTGHDHIGNPDDDCDFVGHSIPQLMEISDDEDFESELESDDGLWDNQDTEELLEILETNVELDACHTGMLYL